MLHVSISAETLFHIGPLSVTNALLTTWLTIIILTIIAWLSTKHLEQIPNSKLQNIFEMIIEFFLDLVNSVVGSEKTRKFFPFITTLFIYILFMNWIELVPGVGTIGIKPQTTPPAIHENTQNTEINTPTTEEHFTPIFRAGTADLNTTLALSLITMITIQYYGIKYVGIKAHVKKFINFSSPMNFLLGILELVSEFAKIISFSFRLFGNLFAGEILLAVTLFLIPFFVPIPFLAIEIFVGLIQAFVFAMLTLVFLNLATEKQTH